jgi:starvation-inducible outer membrane lipoprotein
MRRLLAFTLFASTLSACAAVPSYLEKPADPSVKVPRVGYQPVTGETKTYRPVGPKGWEELNRRVGPGS